MKIELTHRELLNDDLLEAARALAEICAAVDTVAHMTPDEEKAYKAGEQSADAEKAAPKKPRTKKEPAPPAMDQQEALTKAREFRAKHGQKAATAIIRKYGAAWDAVKPEDYVALVADMDAYDKEHGGDDDTGGADDPLAV